MTFTDFIGAAKRIEDIDLPRIGHMIGVGEDEVHAVLDVEANGVGFDAINRPKALYEPHIAYRISSGATRSKLVNLGLAYPRWGAKPYPKDSYPRIMNAMKIDSDIALRSTSWGLGQILGENHRAAGYLTAEAMVKDFMADEDNHLEAMINFIKANKIDDDLRRHDWKGFARVYNGPRYYVNQYDKKLAAAYARWSKIADTPWTPDQPVIDPTYPDHMPVLRKGINRTQPKLVPYVRILQQRLVMHSHIISVDGDFGTQTESAVKGFQLQNRIAADGVVGNKETWPLLLSNPLQASAVPAAGGVSPEVTCDDIMSEWRRRSEAQ